MITIPQHDTPAIKNYKHVLNQMKGDKDATIVCLKMMTWVIKDIEINTGIDLSGYKNIWEEAFNISLE